MPYGTVLPQARKRKLWRIDDFSGGLGGFTWEPGRYYWGVYVWPTRPGYLATAYTAGSADALTGIAASEKTVREMQIGADIWRITSTKVYVSSAGTGNWTEKSTGVGWPALSPNPTDICFFQVSGGNPIIVVCFGTGTKWYYTVDNGTNWAASGMSGNAAYANYMTVAARGGTAPKVWWVRDPNELYSAFDPTGTTFAGPSFVGDYVNDEHNSLVEDVSGTLLIGKRRYLWTIDSLGNTYPLAGPYPYKATRALGTYAGYPTQPGNANFQTWTSMEGRIYYVVDDYRIIEYDHGSITENLQPSSVGAALVLRLPVVGMVAYNTWLIVALSDTSPTLLDSSAWPGGAALAGNTGNTNPYNGGFSTTAGTTMLYVGQRQSDGSWIWHGTFDVLNGVFRYLSYNEPTGLLRIHKEQVLGDTSRLMPKPGLEGLTLGNMFIETGAFRPEGLLATLRLKNLRANILASTSSLYTSFWYRLASDELATAYTKLNIYNNSTIALTGSRFPPGTTTHEARLLICGDGSHTIAPIESVEIEYE